mmetsp:Transcript_19604/g.32699  ORF Transcript_19604/g.32699 Transcript_19604/m.32699 type:complete len:871 (-) Transcript_19604:1551-4163(-)
MGVRGNTIMRWLSAFLVIASWHPGVQGLVKIPLVRRMKQPDRNLRDDTFKHVTSIHRENDGVYWSNLLIGKPPQKFSVIVDTGSSTIAVPCAGCDCGNHNLFEIDKDTLKSVFTGRRYSQCYSEGSCNSGKYVAARMCLGEDCDVETEGIEHNFGCCSTFAHAFKKQEADGIIGVSSSSGTLLADLRSKHKLEENIFSLCLSKTVGVLTVGGFDATRHIEPIQWTPMDGGNGFFRVHVNKFYLDGKLVEAGNIPTPIVDSGTTFTYVPSRLHAALKERLREYCKKSDERCKGTMDPPQASSSDKRDTLGCFLPPTSVSDANILEWYESFPTMEIEHGGQDGEGKIKVCVPSSTYLFKSKHGVYCVGILKDRSRFIIGAVTMSGFDYVFDHDNKRLGIAKSVCNPKSDNLRTVRKGSTGYCCGSCAKAASAPTTSPPDASTPTTSPPDASTPTTSPPDTPPTLAPLNDKYFTSKSVDNEIRLVPIAGSNWESSNYEFGSKFVLVLEKVTAKLCSSPGKRWVFQPGATILVKGQANVTLGGLCAFESITVDELGYVQTQEKSTINVKGTIKVAQGHFVARSEVVFLEKSNVSVIASSTFDLESNGKLSCAEGHKPLQFQAGMITMSGQSVVDCETVFGTYSQAIFVPNGVLQKPVYFMKKTLFQGTVVARMSASPFYGFCLYSTDEISFDSDHTTKLRVEFDQVGSIFSEGSLPERTRLFTSGSNSYGFEEKPAKVEFSAVLRCSEASIDPTNTQVTFTSDVCVNKCIDDQTVHKPNCSPDEKERFVRQPDKTQVNESSGILENDYVNNLVKNYVPQLTVKTKKSLLSGSVLGWLAGIILFIAIYPPAIIKRLCCGCCSSASGRSGRKYDNL